MRKRYLNKREKEANQKEQLWVWSSVIDMTRNQASQKKNMREKERIGSEEAENENEKKKKVGLNIIAK